MPSTRLDIISDQIDAAQLDLKQYSPIDMDWHSRAKTAAGILVPWLEERATAMKEYVEGVLNAPLQLRQIWAEIREFVKAPIEQIEAFDKQLDLDEVLSESITGDLVSKVVTKFMLGENSALASNGRSDYPDIYIRTTDYSGLPQFKRTRKGELAKYGAALKGKHLRPVRIPDGLEIKTCRKKISVDCHYAHAGMHLALVYASIRRRLTVTDLGIAFLRASDYRESQRNTGTTTVKFSFNGERFISLLSRN